MVSKQQRSAKIWTTSLKDKISTHCIYENFKNKNRIGLKLQSILTFRVKILTLSNEGSFEVLQKTDNIYSHRCCPRTFILSLEMHTRHPSRGCTGHSKHPLPTTKEETLHTDVTRCSIPKSDWLYSLQPKMENLYRFSAFWLRSNAKMEKLYPVSKNKTGSWQWLRSWTPYCKIQTEIEKQKTTRPFRYDLNQIPFNYTVS